jgi:hypothetical protein
MMFLSLLQRTAQLHTSWEVALTAQGRLRALLLTLTERALEAPSELPPYLLTTVLEVLMQLGPPAWPQPKMVRSRQYCHNVLGSKDWHNVLGSSGTMYWEVLAQCTGKDWHDVLGSAGTMYFPGGEVMAQCTEQYWGRMYWKVVAQCTGKKWHPC